MARRRQQVHAESRRRPRLALVVIAASVAVVAAVLGVLRSSLLDVDSVVVARPSLRDGAVDRGEIARASGIRRGDAMIDVDPVSARAAVMALPSVASARVEREWPGRVRITVVDERPLAVLVVGEASWVVSRGGRVISAAGTSTAGGDPVAGAALPRIEVDPRLLGDAAPLVPGRNVPDVVGGVVVMVEQMSPSLLERLSAVEVAPDATSTLALADDAGRVAVGPAEDIPAKLLSVDSVLAGVDLRCMAILDVREPSRPTVSRREGCQANPPTVGATSPPDADVAPARGARR